MRDVAARYSPGLWGAETICKRSSSQKSVVLPFTSDAYRKPAGTRYLHTVRAISRRRDDTICTTLSRKCPILNRLGGMCADEQEPRAAELERDGFKKGERRSSSGKRQRWQWVEARRAGGTGPGRGTELEPKWEARGAAGASIRRESAWGRAATDRPSRKGRTVAGGATDRAGATDRRKASPVNGMTPASPEARGRGVQQMCCHELGSPVQKAGSGLSGSARTTDFAIPQAAPEGCAGRAR